MSDTQTLTLTEFLLARIAEDEADAGRETWGQPIPGDCWGPDRVLAECEAHRRIVEFEILRCCDNVPRSGFVSADVADAIRGRADTPILRALALPYADHPDFREEWRP